MIRGDLKTVFENSLLFDFADPKETMAFASEVQKTMDFLPVKVPVVINGQRKKGRQIAKHYCPSDTNILVSETEIPELEDADEALRHAMDFWPEWSGKPVEERAAVLEKLAGLLEQDRVALAALETYEVGKPWREADADIAEAIDFCRYYAREAVGKLGPKRQSFVSGESNIMLCEGRGPTLILAPWNFPIAILCGMTTAALVAGNSVIIKPSSKSCATAYEFFTRLIKAGAPEEAVHFIPGAGGTVGDYLVSHPLIAQIAFTGSKEVGLSIVEKAGVTVSGQPQVKRVVCEMGGKNAIIVDDDADMDQAISGVVKSAFGYAGQKCSACSRVIIVGQDTYEIFAKRLEEACKSLIVAPAHESRCRLGPVVDKTTYDKLVSVIEEPGEGAEPVYIGDIAGAPNNGYYLPPAVFLVKDFRHTLMQKELFGPILALYVADDFDEALKIAVSTEYALTGGLYSRSPVSINKAFREFKVGNLYINRHITGAFVQRQPFGGFGMSGIGSKAGGPDYLMHFVQPRVVTENTMRRGFVPEEL